jgi:hypothetical protein
MENIEDFEEGAQGKTEAGMEELLTKVDKAEQNTAFMKQIMADPDVMKVLQMKQEGKKFTIADAVTEQELPPDFSNDDLFNLSKGDELDVDTMSNRELLQYIQKSGFSKISEMVQKAISPLSKKMESVDGFVNNSVTREAEIELQKLQEKYPDAPNYYKDMTQLNKSNPNLSVHELYALARYKRGELPIQSINTSSERPTSFSRPTTKKNVPIKTGQAGWKDLLMQGISSVEVS